MYQIKILNILAVAHMARMVCRLTWLTGSQIYKAPFLSLASTVFCVELFVIFLLDSEAKQLDTDFIICPILFCSILGFKFQVLHVNLGIIIRYNRLDFFRMSGQCSSHSFPRISPASVCRPHLLRIADFSALLVSFSSDFL